jgi:uncharacterized membrane protein YfcA
MLDLSNATIALLFATACLAGFVDAIAGGGGMITIPALLSVGIPPHLALGTNKLQACFGSLTAALNYHRTKMVKLRETVLGIGFTAVGAFAGTMFVQVLAPHILSHLIPFLLLGLLIYMLFNPKIGTHPQEARIGPPLFYTVFGLLIGFYDGFFGPGVGTIWTMAFAIWLGFDLKRSTAYTKMMNFTSNAVSVLVFGLGGNVLIIAGVVMGVGQMLGAYLGSHLVLKRGTRFVRVFSLAIMTITTVKLLWLQ